MRVSTSHLSGGGVFEGGMFGMPVRRSLGYFGDFGISPVVAPLPPEVTQQAVTQAQATMLTTASPIIQQVIAKNLPIMTEAQSRLAEYKKNRVLIDKLPLKDQREHAMGLVKQKWPAGFLGIGAGKYNLDELAARVEEYLKLPPDQSFYRYELKGSEVVLSDSRVERYEAFKDGNKALRDYLKQFLPVDVQQVIMTTTQKVGFDSTKLLADATAMAAKARATRSANDAVASRTLAEQAREAAKLEKNSANESAATAIFEEMDKLAQSLGAQPAARVEGTPLWVYLSIGGGVIAVLGLVYMMTRK